LVKRITISSNPQNTTVHAALFIIHYIFPTCCSYCSNVKHNPAKVVCVCHRYYLYVVSVGTHVLSRFVTHRRNAFSFSTIRASFGHWRRWTYSTSDKERNW